MNSPNFDELRAARNARWQEQLEKFANEMGVPMESIETTFDPNSCYCACTHGGPCEHKWDGKPYESERMWSTTCSRCGMTAFSHSMHTDS